MAEFIGWQFRKLDPGQKAQNPTHREHLKHGVVEALIREAIQNSLDATLSSDEGGKDGEVTTVHMTLGSVDASRAAIFFEGLRPHLEACKQILPEPLGSTRAPISYLAIEDFNTRGLAGAPEEWSEYNPDGTKNHFYHFWHAVGQSPGEHKRRGSWGVGKVVFSNASAIRTFFGYTIRLDDPAPLFMGETGLLIHRLPDGRDHFDWYGHYAAHLGKADRYCPLPLRGDESQSFRDSFNLKRTNEPGLSVVIPFLRSEVTLSDLGRQIIDNYFLPILSGRLEVTIASGSIVLELKRETLRQAMNFLDWPDRGGLRRDEIEKMISLAEWTLSQCHEEHIQLNPEGDDGPLSMDSGRWPEEQLKATSQAYLNGERIAIRVPIRVRPKGQEISVENVTVILERDDSLRRSNIAHIRSGITLPDLRDSAGPGVRGLLLIGSDNLEQGSLDKLLQLSEGPAHRKWEERGEHYDKARTLFEDAQRTIRFVRKLVRAIVEQLTMPGGARDYETLRSFFPDPEVSSSSKGGAGSARGNGAGDGPDGGDPPPPPPPPPPPTREKMFKRLKHDDGFSIKGNPRYEGLMSPIRVRMAYASWGGSPYRKYVDTDFSLLKKDQLNIEIADIFESKVEEIVKAPNIIEFKPRTVDFCVTVRGFDRKRALHADARVLREDTEKESENE